MFSYGLRENDETRTQKEDMDRMEECSKERDREKSWTIKKTEKREERKSEKGKGDTETLSLKIPLFLY